MVPERIYRIGTRGSPLALAQAREVRARLMRAHGLPESAFDIVVIRTTGDKIQDRPLSETGGKGLFTKEIDEALLDGRVDLAVHSAKDMPTFLPEGLVAAAFLEREDVRDAFISLKAQSLRALPEGAVVGTVSLRRQALVKRLRPDLRPVPIRGNVETRLRKLRDGEVDATLLALAGLRRLGLAEHATALLDEHEFPPACGQGAICVETRDDDLRGFVAAVGHAETEAGVAAERAFLAALDGSCRTPIAGFGRVANGRLRFRGLILKPDGSEAHEAEREGDSRDAEPLGRAAGEELRRRGGPGFFAS